MARDTAARTFRKYFEMIAYARREVRKCHERRARRNDLERQRHAIEPPYDVRDHGYRFLTERKAVIERTRTLDEHRECRRAQCRSRSKVRSRLRNGEWSEAQHGFAVYAKRLATGCKHAKLGHLVEQLVGGGPGRLDKMFAAIENEQDVLSTRGRIEHRADPVP